MTTPRLDPASSKPIDPEQSPQNPPALDPGETSATGIAPPTPRRPGWAALLGVLAVGLLLIGLMLVCMAQAPASGRTVVVTGAVLLALGGGLLLVAWRAGVRGRSRSDRLTA